MEYFTSDTHFFHENIIDYCDRPFDGISQMNQAIIERWNNVVTDNDVVYHLGDVGVPWRKKNAIEILSELNGNKILIMGNHDTQYDKAEFEHLCIEVHEKYHEIDLPIGEGEAATVRMQHNPHDIPVRDEFAITGHVHEQWKFKPNLLNVGVDVWDFKPISAKKVAECFYTNKERREYALENYDYYDPRVRINELEGRVNELENKLDNLTQED